MQSEWGRKETVVWPPSIPLYSVSAFLLCLCITAFFVAERFVFTATPLQRFYTSTYIAAGVGSFANQSGTQELIYVLGGKYPPRLAVDGDVIKGRTVISPGKAIGVSISPGAQRLGYLGITLGKPVKYSYKALYQWLKVAVFSDQSLLEFYKISLIEGLLILIPMLALSMPQDMKRFKEMKYGRRLKGPVLLTPKAFNKEVKGRGIGFQSTEIKERIRLPEKSEAQHIEIMGDTGAGKTSLLFDILQQIRERGDSAIVYDPACEFVSRFYDEKRNDIVLNPLDARCPYWGPAQELRRRAEAKTIAASLYQPTSDKKGEFFTETPQKIFAHLLTFGPTPRDLVDWLSNPAEVDKRVAGTEMAMMIAKGAQQQRNGVLASLGLIADSLRFLPTLEEAGGRAWTATEWSETRQGWIFLTSQPTEREAIRPLHSLWIDLLVLRLMNAPKPGQRRVWFVIDELATLQRLPQLHTALTETRKSDNPMVLGFQGKAQVEVPYGKMAEVMLSQPATKIFLRTSYPASEWVSNSIGKVEIERVKETKHTGQKGHRNLSLDRQVEPLVMDSEIQGLEDKHAFLKLHNRVVRFAFNYTVIPQVAEGFLPRIVEDDELGFDPTRIVAVPHKQEEEAPVTDLEAGLHPEDQAEPQTVDLEE